MCQSPWSSLHSPQPLSDICLYWLSFLYSDLILKVKLKFCFNGIIVQPCCNIFHLLFVDHISCFIKWLSWHGLDSKGAAIWCTHPGWCYVELSMTKDWLLQPHTNLL